MIGTDKQTDGQRDGQTDRRQQSFGRRGQGLINELDIAKLDGKLFEYVTKMCKDISNAI